MKFTIQKTRVTISLLEMTHTHQSVYFILPMEFSIEEIKFILAHFIPSSSQQKIFANFKQEAKFC